MPADQTTVDIGDYVAKLGVRIARLEQAQTSYALQPTNPNPVFTTITVGPTGTIIGSGINSPTSLTITPGIFLDQIYVDLSWTAPTQDSTHFAAERYQVEIARKVSGVYQSPTQYSTAGTAFRAENLLPNTTYGVRVYAFNRLGIPSVPIPSSGYTDFTTGGDTTIPSNITGLTLTTGFKSLVAVWNDTTDFDFDYYELQISTSNTFPVGASTFDIIERGSIGGRDDLTPGTTYYVRVRGVDQSGNTGAWTSTASATTAQVTTGDITVGAITNALLNTGAVTADKTNLAIGGANLLSNSNMESLATPALVNWDTSTGSGATSRSSTQKHSGSFSVSLVRASGNVPVLAGNGANSITIPAGQKVVISAWVYLTAAVTLKLNLFGTGGGANDLTPVTANTSLLNQWQRVSTVYTIPNTVAFVPRAYMDSGIDGTAYVDDYQLEYGDMVTAYAPRPDEILPGVVGTTEIADNAITSPKIIANAIVAGKIAAGVITATEIAANTITGDRIAAGTITSERLTVGTFSPSILPNGGFEDVQQAAATLPAKWAIDVATNGSIALTTTASQVRGGSRALRFVNTTNTANLFIVSDKFPIETGKTYAHEAQYRVDGTTLTAGIYYEVFYFDSSQAFISSANILNNVGGVSGTWNLFQGSHLAPANAAFMQLRIGINNPDQTSSATEFDEIKVYEQIAAVRIQDGQVSAQKMVVGTITAASGILANLAVGTAQIQDAAIVNAKIGALAVDTANIANAAILTAKIADAQITDAKIVTLTVGKVTAGTVTSQDFVLGSGGQIKTATISSGGFILNNQGLSVYDSSGTRVIYLDAVGGTATFKGNVNATGGTFAGSITASGTISGGAITGATITGGLIRTATSGARITLDSSASTDKILLYTTNPSEAAAGYIFTGYGLYDVYAPSTNKSSTIIRTPTTTSFTGTYAQISMTSGVSGDNASRLVLFADKIGFQTEGGGTMLDFTVNSVNTYGSQITGTYHGNASKLLGYEGHAHTFGWNGTQVQLYVDGSLQVTINPGTKTFVINHPTDPRRWLVHAAPESPNAEVRYSGTGTTHPDTGECWVELPDYFEALVHDENRRVIVTAFDNGFERYEDLPVLVPTEPVAGMFRVRGPIGRPHRFSWEVIAERKDVARLDAEPLRTSVSVKGDGPYRYLVPAAA